MALDTCPLLVGGAFVEVGAVMYVCGMLLPMVGAMIDNMCQDLAQFH